MLYSQKILNIDTNDTSEIENFDKKAEELKQDIENNNDYKALKIAFNDNDLHEIINFVDKLKTKFNKLLVIGIGGSSLGAKTLTSLADNNNVQFLENIDNEKVESAFNNLDYQNTAILTVSKSGKTIECISQTLILMNIYIQKFGEQSIKEHFFFLTENKESPLTKLAQKFNIQVIEHDKNIGGRFSYLSNVGLIPACFAGLNIANIRNGAKSAINYFLEGKNFIKDICCGQNLLYKNGIVGNILMTYCERLNCLLEWYRQLWAESLGKDGFGTLPIPAVGTIDQHSQLQLYLGGKKNLFFTFFIKKNDSNSLKIDQTFIEDFKYLNGKTLNDIMQVEAQSTIEILNRSNLPIRVFEYENVDETLISQLMMQFILETITIGKMNNVNPFGQPNVEAKKELARDIYKNWGK